MTTKIIALLTGVSAAVLCIVSVHLPNDPYFYFVSGGIVVGICRLLLAIALVNLVFQSKFVYKDSQWLAGIVGGMLIVFGMIGLVVPSLDYSLYNFIKPLDFLYFAGIGTMFTSAALSYDCGTRPLPRLSHWRASQLRLLSRSQHKKQLISTV